MNKFFSKKFVIISSAIFIVFGGIWGAWKAQDYFAKRNIEKAYNQIEIPDSLILQRKSWTSGSIDVTKNWTYTYNSSDTKGKTTEKLKAAFIKANYNVENSFSALYAKSKNHHISLSVSLYPPYIDEPPQRVEIISNKYDE